MLPLALVRGLFRFTLNTPALEVLSQLPPQIGKRNSLFPAAQPDHYRLYLDFALLFCCDDF